MSALCIFMPVLFSFSLSVPANQCVYPPFRTTDESPEPAEPWQAKSPVLMNTHLK